MNEPYDPHSASTDEELLPVVDEHDRPIGVRRRREIHRLGLRHRSVQVCLVDPAGRIWLQKRSRRKDTFPGWWDMAVTGHVEPGETYAEAAIRELREELGLAAQPRWIGRTAAAALTGWEFQEHYLLRWNGPITDFNREEIDELRPFRSDEIEQAARANHPDLRLTPGVIYILPHLLAALKPEQTP
ncbi:MAG TPA: NUDIX domain-containing protein [Candidatus Sumerlaeota bacterium]|nr:NUDIX domain-containing protein [Candidatus Sumerlaeota bacterium]HPK02380.1 NUDIX domain-containing protein [Candidatus Sumerlaeota bacterium]